MSPTPFDTILYILIVLQIFAWTTEVVLFPTSFSLNLTFLKIYLFRWVQKKRVSFMAFGEIFNGRSETFDSWHKTCTVGKSTSCNWNSIYLSFFSHIDCMRRVYCHLTKNTLLTHNCLISINKKQWSRTSVCNAYHLILSSFFKLSNRFLYEKNMSNAFYICKMFKP